ncbi:uncharacterized protein LOC122392379 [Amphibalanus amphitrite]|uniref:uncharacterized protein LOC122392379 n=1 Tax=Amphibalanus amphitrite TaxID=1232801 RepID=UPI001C8FBF81|nr:uncharacterized protein LOC122392379 [Amphibalanus amphitrite]XP_043243113.1 uncharacterized protein LOC122392379 [Amphibalanus amphitrite]XP_043243115.1 uncharacterized protein LOC122392379 [Amphibalanus amphitrite]XP_043243116.1 uncharacterized protein LOC122392379 [Amphibalanus amphitrite]
MTTDISSSYSCSTLRSQEDTSPTKHPAIRSLKTSRRDEISEGFDSLSGLLSDLRSAQDDAQQEVSRALKERDKLLSCLQNKDENDDRMQDFLSQLNVAESRCSNLHDQLDFMKQMYTNAERCARSRRQAPRDSRSPSVSRRNRSPTPCRSNPNKKVQQYIVQRRRSLSNSTHPQPSRSPPRRRQNASSPSLRNSNPCTSRSPGRKPPCTRGKQQTRPGVRLRAESLLRQAGGGRRDRGDETDADGDHLWCDKTRPRSRSRCAGGILANASKYVPGSVQELRERSRAASLASRSRASRSPAPARGGRPRRRAASESVGRRCGPDSGIDSDSESPSRLARHTLEREQRTRTQRDKQYQMGRAPLPFLSSSNTNKSHHIGANIQHVMSLAKQAGGCTRSGAPLPDIKVGRLPARGPFLRYRRRKPFRYHDKMEIDKYKIEVDPRSCGPDNTADFARYERDRQGCVIDHSETREMTRRAAYRPAPANKMSGYDEDARSAASVQVQKMLCNPATLRKTKRSLKQLLEELAEEFAGLECVCQQLETDMGRADGSVDRCQLEEQIGRLETMMEERRRQVCCLLKLYKQIKKLSRAGVGAGGQDGSSVRGRRLVGRAGRGLPARPGRPMRVNTRIQPNSVRPRGVTFSMQKNFPLRPVQPRSRPAGQPRPRRPAGSKNADPIHCAQLKVLRDMRNIQRRMRIEMGEEY